MEMINVGFPISVISWAHRIHDQNICSEYLAVGICSVDFSNSVADDLSQLTLKTLDLNYLQMTNNSKKENGHVLIYKIVVNTSTKNLEKTLLCTLFRHKFFILNNFVINFIFFLDNFVINFYFLSFFIFFGPFFYKILFFDKDYTIQTNHGGVLDLKWSPKPSNDKHGDIYNN